MKINNFNIIYNTVNYGQYKVIKDYGLINNRRMLRIKFLLTGYEMDIRDDYLGRDLLDPYYPRIHGVACKGNLPSRGEYKMDYDRWIKMISRCYNPDDKDYPLYGGIGVTVDSRWLCFENYYYDIHQLDGYSNYIESPRTYQLDKDMLQKDTPKENRVYSKNTCKWISRRDNIIQRALDGNYKNKYHGVYENHGYYYSTVLVNGNKINVGKFTTPEMAANAHNYYLSSIGLEPINNVEYIPPEEFSKDNLLMKIMVHKINNK